MIEREQIVQVDKDVKDLSERVTKVEANQSEMKESLVDIRTQSREQFEKLMVSITANKIAWAQMSTGSKVIAWSIGVFLTVATVVTGAWVAIKQTVKAISGS